MVDGTEIYLSDSHCHLDDKRFEGRVGELLGRAWDEGVRRIIAVATLSGLDGARRCIEIADRYEWVHPVIGLHPHEAKIVSDDLVEEYFDLVRSNKVVAVGEIGLDFHYNCSPPEIQIEAFRMFIRLAKRLGKPIVIHCREAMPEVIRVIDEEDGWSCGGVFHCFSGCLKDAELIVEKGFYISFSATLTYPGSIRLRQVASKIPLEKILIETDAPYLAPQPKRGRTNEPSYVRFVAEAVAREKGMKIYDVAASTTANVQRLFSIFPT